MLRPATNRWFAERYNVNNARNFNGNNGNLNNNNVNNGIRVQAVANLHKSAFTAMTDNEFFSLMLDTMYVTRKNKRYGKDSVTFESDWAPLLVQMTDELNERTFRIRHNYAFLTSIPKWREIFATEFQGRIADHLLCDILRPFIEQELHPRTFNNREGMGTQAAINQVIEDITTITECGTRPARIIKWDLKGFFPNARCSYMERCFRTIINKYRDDIIASYGESMPEFLSWLAMVTINSEPASNCELRTPPQLWLEHIKPDKSLFTKPSGIGVPIGRLTSQTGMGLYINDDVAWLNDEVGLLTTVFMDDGVMVVSEERHQYALQHLPVLRERLAAKGVAMNDKKFYDQPWQHGLEFLGSHIHDGRIILNDATWKRCIDTISDFNSKPVKEKYRTLDNFLSSINSYTGLLKNRTSYNRIQTLVSMVHPDYLQWLEWDKRRQCFVCKPEHSFRVRLKDKYHLKLKRL